MYLVDNDFRCFRNLSLAIILTFQGEYIAAIETLEAIVFSIQKNENITPFKKFINGLQSIKIYVSRNYLRLLKEISNTMKDEQNFQKLSQVDMGYIIAGVGSDPGPAIDPDEEPSNKPLPPPPMMSYTPSSGW